MLAARYKSIGSRRIKAAVSECPECWLVLVVAGWEFLRTSLRTVYTVSTHKRVPVLVPGCSVVV